MSILDPNKKYTYADYLTWPDGERWEIIDGVPYMMTSPTFDHQTIALRLGAQFDEYLLGKQCNVAVAPFDVCLVNHDTENNKIDRFVQPDVVIFCDQSKLKNGRLFGIPEIVIEVLSPSTSRYDWFVKFNLYERVGVKQYWIIDLLGKWVQIFTLQDNNKYGLPEKHTYEEKFNVSLFPDLEIDLNRVFAYVNPDSDDSTK